MLVEKISDAFDEHARLGLEAEHDARRLGTANDRLHLVHEALPAHVRRNAGRSDAAPQRHDARAEVPRDRQRALEKLPPARATLDLDADVRVEGIESGVVEGEGAALVSELGDHPERVIEPVMGEAVRVVAVAERPRLHALANRRPSTYAGTKHAATSAPDTRPRDALVKAASSRMMPSTAALMTPMIRRGAGSAMASRTGGPSHAASSARKTRPVRPPGPHPRTNSATAMARSAAKPLAAARTRVTGAVITSKRLTSVRMRT